MGHHPLSPMAKEREGQGKKNGGTVINTILKTFENVGNLCSKHQQTETDFSQLMDCRKMP